MLKQSIFNLIGEKNVRKIQYQLSLKDLKRYDYMKNKKKILLFLVPGHGNLGDHAIAYAAIRYFKDKLPNYEIIEVNFKETYKYGKALKRIVNDDDLVFILGGGNMGNQYLWEENIRRNVITRFKNTKVISLPQTIYFTDDEDGKIEFEQTKKIYNDNKNLLLVAREDKSYSIMKRNFDNCNIIKCPDIVFYLNEKLDITNLKREQIMTCLRKDKETYLSIESKQEFINELNKSYKNVVETDTVVNRNVNQIERENELFRIWKEFYKSKVVITDRLHGMIFCAITKTPCIVVRSLDHKITESYKWIKDLNYIKLIDKLEFKEIQPIIDEFINLKNIDQFDFDNIYFNSMLNEIIK